MSTLSCTNLFVYRGQRKILSDLTIHIQPGEHWGLLGVNGCGKSTLLLCLAGLLEQQSGEIRYNGLQMSSYGMEELAALRGWLSQQEDARFPYSVDEYIRIHHGPSSCLREDDRPDQIPAMDLDHIQSRKITRLSGGEWQRVRLAALLSRNCPVLLLDEPSNHLDPKHKMMLMKRLSQHQAGGGSIVSSLHDLQQAEQFCSHVLLIFPDGHHLAGPKETLMNEENLARLYDCDVVVHRLQDKKIFHFPS